MGYWEERQEAMFQAGEMMVNQYFTRLERAFNQTKKELQKTIEAFYFRYAQENGLSYAAAQKRLDQEELGELRDFIGLVMENIGRYNQTVNNLSVKSRLTRYQALEAQVEALLRQLYAVDYEAMAGQAMKEVYEESYYRVWYSADQYHGSHLEFAQIEPRAVQALLEYPFNGANFSSRLWKQKEHLKTQLMEALTTMMIQGKYPKTLAKDLTKKMQSKKFDAYRLLHTESSFLMSEAAHAGYKEDGVEKYRILATLDSKTCGVCGELDGKAYPVDEAVVGVNMPPFHPLCRCTDVPYYDDIDVSDMPRAARDPQAGKPYDVPGDMTYNEWKSRFLKKDTHVFDGNRLKLPDNIMGVRGMTEDKRIEIEKAITIMQKKYGVQIGAVSVESAGPGERHTLMISGPYVSKDGHLKMALVINADIDYNVIDKVIAERYKAGYFASKNISDVVVHEMAHIMTFQNCHTPEEYKALRKKIKGLYVKGVSGYSDKMEDGAETLAEAFVRMKNGESVPLSVRRAVKQYVLRG